MCIYPPPIRGSARSYVGGGGLFRRGPGCRTSRATRTRQGDGVTPPWSPKEEELPSDGTVQVKGLYRRPGTVWTIKRFLWERLEKHESATEIELAVAALRSDAGDDLHPEQTQCRRRGISWPTRRMHIVRYTRAVDRSVIWRPWILPRPAPFRLGWCGGRQVDQVHIFSIL